MNHWRIVLVRPYCDVSEREIIHRDNLILLG
jgi:hypothetical protein